MNIPKTRPEALRSLVPKADFSWVGGDYSGLSWNDKREKPTEEEIDAEVIRLQAEYDSQEYARKRLAEYPSIESLVVGLYDTDDKSAIEAKRAEVKAKYPKPE